MSDPRLGYAYSYGAEPSGFVGAAPPSAAGAVWRGTGAPRTRELGRSNAAAPLAWNAQPPFGAALAQQQQQQHTLRQPPPAYSGQSYGGAVAAPYASSGYSDDEGSAGSDADGAFSDDAASDDDDGVVYSDDENGDEGARGSWDGGVYGAAPAQSSWW
ncbi:hypothetical protein pneo_cds_26 [Pandoravirus neocaledonia]|uniref:Uncharacterized protein n=1 Tax=Pandoravirus neocaledonia TaxID=2107708 RepID=A0A2U7UB03_9VIRU|nr:hypothetical protein pneo_cds_26 [Pandoravirus neocaledonia]AVK75633.1 hypothetical protein pneo_cds_26 [Pandoravirus neocaledonia]